MTVSSARDAAVCAHAGVANNAAINNFTPSADLTQSRKDAKGLLKLFAFFAALRESIPCAST